MIHYLRDYRLLPYRMNEPRDLRVEDEPLSGGAAVADARVGVVVDSGARGAPEEGGSLVGVMQ